MPVTHYTLDTFVSQEISKLTSCEPQSLAVEFPEHNRWLNQFILRRIFHNHVSEEHAALAFILIRRTEAALEEWELACAVAQNVREPSGYFKMLRHLENCIAALWQGFEFCRRALKTNLFERGDESTYERLNWLYNVGRHFDTQELQLGDLHRIWISNDGLHSREHSVTFSELRDAIKFLADMVKKFSSGSPRVD